MSLEDSFNLDPRSAQRAVANGAPIGTDAQGHHAGRSVRAACRSHRDLRRSRGRKTCSCSTMPRRAFGASWQNRRVGTLADATATSFFPAKPLGCYGDGGAVFTDDDELIEVLRSLRVHGQGRRPVRLRAARAQRPVRHRPGGGADREAEDLSRGDRRARAHRAALLHAARRRRDSAAPERRARPRCGRSSRCASGAAGRRDALASALKAQGIPTAIYYPKPVHVQEAYRRFPVAEGGLPVSERLAGEVLSLPMHPYLDEADPGPHHRGGASARSARVGSRSRACRADRA